MLHRRIRYSCVHTSCMSPALSGSSYVWWARNTRRNNIQFLFGTATHVLVMFKLSLLFLSPKPFHLKVWSAKGGDYLGRDLLLVDLVSLRLVEDEKVVSSIRWEHLQCTVSQKVSPLVDLSYCVIRPLDAAEGKWDGKGRGRERKGGRGGEGGSEIWASCITVT